MTRYGLKRKIGTVLTIGFLFLGSKGYSQERKLPDGSIVYSDGTRRLPNGTIIYKGGNVAGYPPIINGPGDAPVYPNPHARKHINRAVWLPPGQAKKIYGGSAKQYAPGQQKKWHGKGKGHKGK
jgi:hypothetical protein